MTVRLIFFYLMVCFAAFVKVDSAEIKALSRVSVNSEYQFVTFNDGSIWAMPKQKEQFYWQYGLSGKNVLTIDVPNHPRIGHIYSVEHRWLSGEEENLNKANWEAIFICQSQNAIDDPSLYGVVVDYAVVDVAPLSPQLGLGNTIFLLTDGSCWLAHGHFSNLKNGEILQIQKEDDKTAIMLRTIKWNNQEKEMFFPARRLVSGIYQL